MLSRTLARSAWRAINTTKSRSNSLPKSSNTFQKSVPSSLPKTTPSAPASARSGLPNYRPSALGPGFRVRGASNYAASTLGRSLYHCWNQFMLNYFVLTDDDDR